MQREYKISKGMVTRNDEKKEKKVRERERERNHISATVELSLHFLCVPYNRPKADEVHRGRKIYTFNGKGNPHLVVMETKFVTRIKAPDRFKKDALRQIYIYQCILVFIKFTWIQNLMHFIRKMIWRNFCYSQWTTFHQKVQFCPRLITNYFWRVKVISKKKEIYFDPEWDQFGIKWDI